MVTYGNSEWIMKGKNKSWQRKMSRIQLIDKLLALE